MQPYNAVLFDLDGTLLNTLDDLTDAVNHTLRAFGYPIKEKDEVRRSVGNGVRKLIERVLPGGAQDADMESALAEFKRYYTAHCNVRTHPYDGVLEALAALSEAGLKLAIVSNKNDEAVKTLAHEYFGSLIDVAVGGRDGMPRKPAPDMPTLQDWGETDPDAVVAALEKIYTDRADAAAYATVCAEKIKTWDWGPQNEKILQLVCDEAPNLTR